MKWIVLPRPDGQDFYQLTSKGKDLLTLEFHPFTNTARMKFDGEKRSLIIRKEGFLRNRTVLRNEYGIFLAQAQYDKSSLSAGAIELEGQHLSFQITTESLSYRVCNESGNVLFTYDISEIASTASLSQQAQILLSLLVSACWYNLLPVKEKNAEELPVG